MSSTRSTSTSRPIPAGAEEQRLVGKGFRRVKPYAVKSGVIRGRNVVQTDLVKNESGTAERIARGVGGVLVAVPTLGTALASDTVWEATMEPAIHGKAKRKIFYDQSQTQPERLPKKMGYDPKNNVDVQTYLARPEIRAELQSDGQGNYFLIEHRREPQGVSSFLFVPKGDFSKAYSVKFYNAKNGKAITDAAQQLRAVRSYAATIATVDEEWEKQVDEMAKKMLEKDEVNPESNMYNDLLRLKKEKIRKRRGPLVLDCKNYQARIYGKGVSLNTDISSTKTGTVIKFEDELQKTINHIHGKDMEHKEKLQGEKPFAKPPKDKTPNATPFPGMARSRPPGTVPTVQEIDSDSETVTATRRPRPLDALGVPSSSDDEGWYGGSNLDRVTPFGSQFNTDNEDPIDLSPGSGRDFDSEGFDRNNLDHLYSTDSDSS